MISVDDSVKIEYGVNKILNNLMDKSRYIKLYILKSKQLHPSGNEQEFASYLHDLNVLKPREEFKQHLDNIQYDFKAYWVNNIQLGIALDNLDRLNKEFWQLKELVKT